MSPQSAQTLLNNPSSASNIKHRFFAPMPTLFKKLFQIMASLSALGIAILGVPATITALGVDFHFPNIVNEVAGYMIAVGTIGATFSKLTFDKDKVQDIADKQQY